MGEGCHGDGAETEAASEEGRAAQRRGAEALAREVEGEANDGIGSTHRVRSWWAVVRERAG